MADWYVSSAAYAAVPVWAASTAYTVGQLVKPTAPASGREYVWRCTTAGTSGGTEPAWSGAYANNLTIASGTAVFTNVTGQSTYGWSAAAGTLYSIANGNSNRPVAGDRVFLSSDHSESWSAGAVFGFNASTAAFGLIQLMSVNRAGSVPPVVVDLTSGAALTVTSGTFAFDHYVDMYWQGMIFTLGGSAAINILVNNASTANKASYFKNCAFVLTNTNAASRLSLAGAVASKCVFDNTTVQFGNAGQYITANAYPVDWTWLNTPSAIQGGTLPTSLISAAAFGAMINLTARGVDLSALTGTLVAPGISSCNLKALLDSCRIAPGLTRLNPGTVSMPTGDEVELVNCFDGTNVLNERYTQAGTVTTDRSTYLSGGAQDDVAAYSLKLASSSRADKSVLTLNNFWIDVENTLTGSSKTATVELVSSGTLNNDDISLLLEYMAGGTTYTVLNPSDKDTHITLSGGNLTAVGTAGWTGFARAYDAKSTGKFYWEVTFNAAAVQSGVGVSIGTINATTSTFSSTVTPGHCGVVQNGAVYVDGSNVFSVGGVAGSNITFGTITSGTVICIAIDLTAKLIWFRLGASGNWNNNAARDPATGVGGASIPNVGTTYPTSCFGGADTLISNFGASAFVGAVPSGFTAGWQVSLGSLASFASSLPAVLATGTALTTSSATWTGSLTEAWNPADVSNVTLSGGNLIATASGTSSGVRGLLSYNSGKLYWEYTLNTAANTNTSVGIAVSSASLAAGPLSVGNASLARSGTINVNNVYTGVTLGARSNGDVIGIAVDLNAGLFWMRVAPSGNWNASGTANPVTGVGGLSLSVLAYASGVYPYFGPATGSEQATANFGASAFTGTAPSGFSAPNTVAIKQKLQVPFTPQRPGRVRGLVRLGKPTTTVWVNPQLTIS